MTAARGDGRIVSLFEPKNLFLFAMVFSGCTLLLVAYTVGYQAAKNIWVVTAASVGSILVVEPVLAWIFFHQLPERGALAGLVLGAAGLIATTVWR